MKFAQTTLITLAGLVLGFSFLVFGAYGINLMTFPFDYDQGEGFELVDTIMFSEFQYPYQNTDTFPFYSSNYPPIYHLMAVPFVWLFGNAYWYGRLLGFLAATITAGLIGFTVHRHSGNRWIAILSGLAFLASNTIYHIAPLFRQHMTMVLFETLAVIVIAETFQRKNWKTMLVGMLLIICAGYTKQLAAFTALAVGAWMFLQNPRRGVLWGVIAALIGGIIFAWLTVSTNGEWWRQAIIANVNAYDPQQTINLTVLWWQLHGLLIIPALLMVAYEVYVDRISLYSIWFVVTAVMGGFSSGKWGGGDSYFATSIAGLCILSGIFWGRLLAGKLKNITQYPYSKLAPLFRAIPITMIAVLIPVSYLGYGISTLKMPTEGGIFGTLADIFNIQPNVKDRHYDSASYDVTGYANIGHFVTQADIAAGYTIVDRMEAITAPILSEEAGFSLVAGREVISNPTQLLNLWYAGLWDGTDLLEMINNKAFGMIVLRAQFYPTPVLEAIGANYEIEDSIPMNGFNYLLLIPR